MYIQSEDYLGFEKPVEIIEFKYERKNLVYYIYIKLKDQISVYSASLKRNVTLDELFIVPRGLSKFSKVHSFPKEILIMSITDKEILATGYLYN